MATSGVATTVQVKLAVPLPVRVIAVTPTVNVPASVGVPEMTPVDALTVRPFGRWVADQT